MDRCPVIEVRRLGLATPLKQRAEPRHIARHGTQRVAPMTNEERDIITQFIARVGGAQRRTAVVRRLGAGDHDAGAAAGRSRGRPADRRPVHPLSRGALPHHPARLRAGARAGRGAEPPPADGVGAAAGAAGRHSRRHSSSSRADRGGGFFSGLFGGGSRPAPTAAPQQGAPAWNQAPQQGYQQAPPPSYQQAPPPPPQYAPSYQPGMFQRSGSGFLGSALTTAAGVAGGLVAGNALMSLFSGSHGGGSVAAGSGRRQHHGDRQPMGRRRGRNQGYVDQGTWRYVVGRRGQQPWLCRQRHLGHLGWQQPGGIAR